jgi:hypothetical protein
VGVFGASLEQANGFFLFDFEKIIMGFMTPIMNPLFFFKIKQKKRLHSVINLCSRWNFYAV